MHGDVDHYLTIQNEYVALHKKLIIKQFGYVFLIVCSLYLNQM